MNSQPHKTFTIFHYRDNKGALVWSRKIHALIKNNFSYLREDSKKPDVVIVLGGDGTILEAARKYHELGSMIFGLNLGHVGFLASARKERDFLNALNLFLSGKYHVLERMMISAQVLRNKKIIFNSEALNEVVIKNLLGMAELEVRVSGHPVASIKGTGILISTATGSTAYNLSAHGPVVMPNIKCFIVTELLDHGIPTPSIVVKHDNKVSMKVISFKKRGSLSITKTGKKVDVVLSTDGESIFPLEVGDEIIVQSSPHLVRFAELEKHYFFKSLEEKFGFK